MMMLGTASTAERASRAHASPSLRVESGGGSDLPVGRQFCDYLLHQLRGKLGAKNLVLKGHGRIQMNQRFQRRQRAGRARINHRDAP